MLEGTFLEIQEATTTSGLEVSKSYNRLNDGIAKRDSIRINLVGAQRNDALTVNFEIDATSTAVAGVHYNMITTGGSTTIPANSSFGYIYFEVLADNIEPGETWNIKFNLTGSSAGNVKLSENYKSFTRGLRILCPFVRSFFLGDYSVEEPGYSGSPYIVTSAVGPDANSITIDNFWDFGGVVTYTFNPANNQVSLPTQDVVMGGVTYVVAQGTGSSTYDACEGNFVVPYTVTRKSDNALFDNNVHTFTKQ